MSRSIVARSLALAGALTLGLATLVAPTTHAAPTAQRSNAPTTDRRDARPDTTHDTTPTVVAHGLDNPRLLSFSASGDLYIAEAGRGGSGPCVTGAEGGDACFGTSGAITRLRRGHQQRVVTGLPSLAGKDGSSASGPSDVVVTGNGRWTAVIGLGNNPAVRSQLPRAGARLGTVVTGTLHANRTSVIADLADYEARRDPDHLGVDSNPTAAVLTRGGLTVVDAGGNDLLRVHRTGRVSTLSVLQNRTAPAPFPGGPPVLPLQPVPTSVAIGPDGAFYVSELTGFPFPVGGARIWRVVPGRTPTVYATGLTNVTDLAWSGRHLYAVQLNDTGLLTRGPGSVVRVSPRGSRHTTVASGLTMPYGIAIRGDAAYVTTCSVCAGGGQVVRVRLP